MKTEEKNLCDDEKSRIAELQRRNTLCLPHLRSAYPMELSVARKGEKEDVLETTIREGTETTFEASASTTRRSTRDDTMNLKRKIQEEPVSLVSFKKTKRPVVPPPPVIQPVVKEEVEEEVAQVKKPAMSFDIEFTPPKNTKAKPPPRLTRSHASSQLSTKSTSALQTKTSSPLVSKKASSTGELKKTTTGRKPATAAPVDKVNNRRFGQTLRKPVPASADTKAPAVPAKRPKKPELTSSKKTTLSKTDTSSSTTSTTKPSGDNFSRTDVKRSSFSKAKTRVAASLGRGKK